MTYRCWVVCLLFASVSLSAGVRVDSAEGRPNIQVSQSAALRFHMLDGARFLSAPSFQVSAPQSAKMKKPAIGILLSAALPGAGEIYAGSWLKGAVLIGVEVALWVGYVHFSDKGQEWEDIFHTYANTHWSEDQWRTWMNNHPEFTDTTHTLPDTKTQQYYEMIGKYDQFKGGWDDYIEGGEALTENRDHYEGLRHESNTQFKRASYCTMLALGNRLLSVFDTAFTIRRLNRQVEARMRMVMKRTGRDTVPALALQVGW